MKKSVFIDGEHGTTGLQIADRLANRSDINLLSLAMEDRRDQSKRQEMLRDADIAILCLPDDAARESVSMAQGANTRFIDASTAHRTADGWIYGFAECELGQKEKIISAQNVSNPGCYPTGAIALLRPLILAGLMPADYPVTINAVSGYSGGGKQLIAQMEDASRDDAIDAPYFEYALGLQHKHVPEIKVRSGLAHDPVFTPNVGRFAQGMLVNVPLHSATLKNADRASVHSVLAEHYSGQDIVKLVPLDDTDAAPRIDPTEMAGTDEMRLYVCGRADNSQLNLVASLDNLGKGASGAAVQNLDLMLHE
ncbi:MAG: N-acetyl-gamma-glutamyl-phosphate reductase [Pseudomonadota bacterium]